MSLHRNVALHTGEIDSSDPHWLSEYAPDIQKLIVGYLLEDPVPALSILPKPIAAPYHKLLERNVVPLLGDVTVRNIYYNLQDYLPAAGMSRKVTLVADLIDSALALLHLSPQQLILYLAEMTRNVNDEVIAQRVNDSSNAIKPLTMLPQISSPQENHYREPIGIFLQSLAFLSLDANQKSEASSYLQWRLLADFRKLVQESISNAYQDTRPTVQEDTTRQLTPALQFTSNFGLFSKQRCKQRAQMLPEQTVEEEKIQRSIFIALASTVLCWTLNKVDPSETNASTHLLTTVLVSLLLAAFAGWSSAVYFVLLKVDPLRSANRVADDLGSTLLTCSLEKLNQVIVPASAITSQDMFTLFRQPRQLTVVNEVAVHEKLIELTQASQWQSWIKDMKFYAWLAIEDESCAHAVIQTLTATDALSAFYIRACPNQPTGGILVADVECEKLLALTPKLRR